MNDARSISLDQIPVLLRGEPDTLVEWLRGEAGRRMVICLVVIVAGAGCYGAVIGGWRSPLQAAYTAVKFPAVLLLTALGNALLNALLAPLLGIRLKFGETFLAILMSFAIVAVVLGAFSPVALFLVWNLPPIAEGMRAAPTTHAVLLLSQVAIVSLAGVAGNLKLLNLLDRLSANPAAAVRLMLAWLATNLFLGAQLTWMLRPFFGSPHLPVTFLRPDALEGNFYESVFYLALRLIHPSS